MDLEQIKAILISSLSNVRADGTQRTDERFLAFCEELAVKLATEATWNARISAGYDTERTCPECHGPIEFGNGRCGRCASLFIASKWENLANKHRERIIRLREKMGRFVETARRNADEHNIVIMTMELLEAFHSDFVNHVETSASDHRDVLQEILGAEIPPPENRRPTIVLLNTPIEIRSFEEFERYFGSPCGNPSVYAGIRRYLARQDLGAVVVRVTNQQGNMRTLSAEIPGQTGPVVFNVEDNRIQQETSDEIPTLSGQMDAASFLPERSGPLQLNFSEEAEEEAQDARASVTVDVNIDNALRAFREIRNRFGVTQQALQAMVEQLAAAFNMTREAAEGILTRFMQSEATRRTVEQLRDNPPFPDGDEDLFECFAFDRIFNIDDDIDNFDLTVEEERPRQEGEHSRSFRCVLHLHQTPNGGGGAQFPCELLVKLESEGTYIEGVYFLIQFNCRVGTRRFGGEGRISIHRIRHSRLDSGNLFKDIVRSHVRSFRERLSEINNG